MSSTLAQDPAAQPNPPDFEPRGNPAFILHGKLKTSFGTVSKPMILCGTSLRVGGSSCLYPMSGLMRSLWRSRRLYLSVSYKNTTG